MSEQGSLFGPPSRWPESDLIGMSEGFDPDVVIAAYRSGVFPMPHHGFRGRDLIGWYSPLDRGILPLDGLKVSRSLRKTIKRYRITVDTDFTGVLLGCADPDRPGGWIDDQIADVYTTLHRAGIVHSVEAWTANGRLAGGLYGVSIGGLFAGESMFHDPVIGRDASKAALVALVDILRADGRQRLLDVQWQTDHLATLGVIEVERRDYLARLSSALRLPPPTWPTGEVASYETPGSGSAAGHPGLLGRPELPVRPELPQRPESPRHPELPGHIVSGPSHNDEHAGDA